ncbi:hypothetical protein COCON_G00235160 [Conger conger]|uniref:non-specific serine/threonine protein kinase n=1 Tax=Conger conger TaxID=82655 RepID=A0A9Q1HIP9_CONCO|nr:hypothetical protein COCON_G00235160 [Conger conger]
MWARGTKCRLRDNENGKFNNEEHILGQIWEDLSGRLGKTLERSSCYAHTEVGTFHYRSPERIEGKPYNSKSDVWALGCVLYELCELQPAFPEESMRDLFNTIVDGPHPTISGQFSTDLRDLVRDLLQKNPGDRPSASDIMARPCILRILCQKSMGIPEELKLKLEELN